MKLALCIIFFVVVLGIQALTHEQRAKMAKISKECRDVTGVSQESVEKARRGEVVDDPKLRAQILCVSKKVGLANDSGDVDVDVLKRKLKKVAENDAEVDQIVQKCVVKKGTPEETAAAIFKCVYNSKPNFSVVD